MKTKGKIREYVEALLTAALIALCIRGFIVEAFKIPSTSMLPTLSVGDHIFVNKFIYGIRVPFTTIRIVDLKTPARGDVIVFVPPFETRENFIKRVVGVPGDHIRIEDRRVFVNDEELQHVEVAVEQHPNDKRLLRVVGDEQRTIPFAPGWNNVLLFDETIALRPHLIQYDRHRWREEIEIVVPPGHLFVMGDNRDNSRDSREWGFVPFSHVKGKAMFVWLSLDHDHGGIRWKQFGRWVK